MIKFDVQLSGGQIGRALCDYPYEALLAIHEMAMKSDNLIHEIPAMIDGFDSDTAQFITSFLRSLAAAIDSIERS